MDNMMLFSEEVRRDLVYDLRRFVGEQVTVEFHAPGRKGRGTVHKGTIAAVYPNGFLVDGEDIGKRVFFSCADLFAEHARVVDGPAASSVRRTVMRLRGELARLLPPRITRSEPQALPA